MLTHSLCPFPACSSSLSLCLTFEDIFSNAVADAGAQALTKIVAFIVAHVFMQLFCVDAGSDKGSVCACEAAQRGYFCYSSEARMCS